MAMQDLTREGRRSERVRGEAGYKDASVPKN